jgi:uncharacterized protein (DUF1778 family)
MTLEAQPARPPSKTHKPRKDRRIEARTDAETEERITRAAALTGTSVSTFVVSAAAERAEEVLARARDVTFMYVEQFDVLMASLETPDEASTLAAAAERPRRFSRR